MLEQNLKDTGTVPSFYLISKGLLLNPNLRELSVHIVTSKSSSLHINFDSSLMHIRIISIPPQILKPEADVSLLVLD